MKKILFIIGTRKSDSRIYNNLNPIIEELKIKGNKVTIISPDTYPILPCEGCLTCFKSMKCKLDYTIDNNSVFVKESLLINDIIVFVSPTYAHNVSGDFKTLIDRLSYWTHLLPLSGKDGLAISFTDTSGAKMVSDYLEKIMITLGINVVLNEPVTLLPPGGELELIKRLDNIKSTLINISTEDNYTPIYDIKLLTIFEIYKKRYSNINLKTSEFIYWNNELILKANKFTEFIDAVNKLKYKYY